MDPELPGAEEQHTADLACALDLPCASAGKHLCLELLLVEVKGRG